MPIDFYKLLLCPGNTQSPGQALTLLSESSPSFVSNIDPLLRPTFRGDFNF